MTHLHCTLTQTLTSGATAVVLLAGLGIAATPQAEAAQLSCTATSVCTLSELLEDDNFLVVGDKKFSDFDYSILGGNAPAPEEISVFGEISEGVFSIAFTGLFLAEPGEQTNALLSHTVEILKPNARFKEVALSANPQGPFAGITEKVFDPNDVEVAQLEVNTDNIPSTLFDMEDISELQLKKIRVEKELDLDGVGGNTASFSIFRQSYTQVDIPEPASVLGLLAVGGLGVALKRKRAESLS
ncbi:MAG: PEP-CTERM sorting domain-containing protein [Cyanobacteriota bacterium]|nr:PEP-CTERM sorting domain-containing protein [Cyanobacteriota bacterium]